MQRRTFLSAAGLSILGRRALLGAPGRSDSSLSTPLCDALGIRLPIVQSGMGRVAGPELAAAVHAAGGRVLSLVPERETLESWFVNVIQNEGPARGADA